MVVVRVVVVRVVVVRVVVVRVGAKKASTGLRADESNDTVSYAVTGSCVFHRSTQTKTRLT